MLSVCNQVHYRQRLQHPLTIVSRCVLMNSGVNMSEDFPNFKVPVTFIVDVRPHENAHSLDVATVYGFQVIVPRGVYKKHDAIVYAPVDSILSEKVEALVFAPDSKVKLDRGRVRQIKLRGLASQGLVIDPSLVMPLIAEYAKSKGQKEITIQPEQDLAEILGITKYEPGPKGLPSQPGIKRNKPKENPLFHKYNGVTALKWDPNYFSGEDVVVQCKLHGTNARYSYLPTATNTLWKKILKVFRILPKYEFCYGSNNVQLTHKPYSHYYAENVYAKMIKQEQINEKLQPGETIYGEIIGPGIQKNYHYGIPEGKHRFVLFDVKKYDGEKSYFLSPDEVRTFALERGFELVPELYRGPYDISVIALLAKGPSVYAPSQPIREGIVIKSLNNYNDESGGKRARKLINEDYLADQSNSDFH
jgi:RNA ligase (TIGR02306 family)